MSLPLIESVVNLGKILFVPVQKTTPFLPAMSILFLKEEERGDIFPWRAVCIDLEIDACGDSVDEAWESLKESLALYINMEKEAAGGSIVEAAKTITKAALSESKQKREYFALYRQAKMEYFIRNIESDTNPVHVMKRPQGRKKAEKGRVVIEVEQEPVQSNFVELNGNILEKVSTTYVFSPQRRALKKQLSDGEVGTMVKRMPVSRDDLFWLFLTPPPQGRIVSPRQLWETT